MHAWASNIGVQHPEIWEGLLQQGTCDVFCLLSASQQLHATVPVSVRSACTETWCQAARLRQDVLWRTCARSLASNMSVPCSVLYPELGRSSCGKGCSLLHTVRRLLCQGNFNSFSLVSVFTAAASDGICRPVSSQ